MRENARAAVRLCLGCSGQNGMNTRVEALSSGMKKWAAASVCSLLGFAWSGSAAAQDGERDCSAVYDAAQEAESTGDLHMALEFYQSCAVDSCSNPARRSCEAHALRLELDAPTIVPLAKTSSGEPIVDADVTMDGRLLTSNLNGRAIGVDPGLHEFVFTKNGKTMGSVRLVVAQGQRNRELWMIEAPVHSAQQLAPVVMKRDMHVAAPRAAVAQIESDNHGTSVAPYLLGGTALLGGGAYALLSTWARNDNRELSRCTPNCPKESVQHIRSLYLAADISLGVGIAAAVGSVASFIMSGGGSEDKPAPQRNFALSVQPERDGALATVRGTL